MFHASYGGSWIHIIVSSEANLSGVPSQTSSQWYHSKFAMMTNEYALRIGAHWNCMPHAQ